MRLVAELLQDVIHRSFSELLHYITYYKLQKVVCDKIHEVRVVGFWCKPLPFLFTGRVVQAMGELDGMELMKIQLS